MNNAFKRWLDDQLGGGMWYRDQKDMKSLYQIGIVFSALQIYEATKDAAFYDRALNCYNWMESHLLRSDGLYWCDYNTSGPVGHATPNHIGEAGSGELSWRQHGNGRPAREALQDNRR